jgi:hypothetical protein
MENDAFSIPELESLNRSIKGKNVSWFKMPLSLIRSDKFMNLSPAAKAVLWHVCYNIVTSKNHLATSIHSVTNRLATGLRQDRYNLAVSELVENQILIPYFFAIDRDKELINKEEVEDSNQDSEHYFDNNQSTSSVDFDNLDFENKSDSELFESRIRNSEYIKKMIKQLEDITQCKMTADFTRHLPKVVLCFKTYEEWEFLLNGIANTDKALEIWSSGNKYGYKRYITVSILKHCGIIK